MYVFSFNTILAKNKIFLDSTIFLLPCAFLGSYNLSKIFALVPTVFIIFASALLDELPRRSRFGVSKESQLGSIHLFPNYLLIPR
jgi:hypothetical protein